MRGKVWSPAEKFNVKRVLTPKVDLLGARKVALKVKHLHPLNRNEIPVHNLRLCEECKKFQDEINAQDFPLKKKEKAYTPPYKNPALKPQANRDLIKDQAGAWHAQYTLLREHDNSISTALQM